MTIDVLEMMGYPAEFVHENLSPIQRQSIFHQVIKNDNPHRQSILLWLFQKCVIIYLFILFFH